MPLKKKISSSNVTEPLKNAVIKAESNGNPNAQSKVGAKGLMQLMDATGKEAHAELSKNEGYAAKYPKYDPFNPEQNVEIGTHVLDKLLTQYKGDVANALAAYNAGQGNVNRAMRHAQSTDFNVYYKYLPKPQETVPYVQRIFSSLTAETNAA